MLVLHGLDLLPEIDQLARAVIMWSIIYTPDPAHRSALRQLEWCDAPEREFIYRALLGGRF